LKRLLLVFFVINVIIVISACKTTPAPQIQTEQQDVMVKPAEPKTEPKTITPEKTDSGEQKAEKSDFILDEVTYKQTKEDLEKLISDLNSIIAAKDYDTWLTYLTRKYFEYYSDPVVLKEQSESPLLKKYNIVLRSLKDYFNYVVVGSRKNVRLDEIKAIDKNHIKAYMYIDDTPVIIYELVKENGDWKITRF